jgi:DNA repair photolyase
MLGELYRPHGLALETAKAVLEVEDPWAVNVAWGCSNGCGYCYGPKVGRQSREQWMKVRLPEKSPADLVREQLRRGLNPEGVFLCFDTDPFLPEIQHRVPYEFTTDDFIYMLTREYGIRVATLSKLDVPSLSGTRAGVTIVSLDDDFWRQFEPNTTPPDGRLARLHTRKKEFGDYVWVSMEPYPPSSIYKQNFEALLERLKFIDLIVFGKWNYDRRARTEEMRIRYAQNIKTLLSFCRKNKIRLHVKSDTGKWAFEHKGCETRLDG